MILQVPSQGELAALVDEQDVTWIVGLVGPRVWDKETKEYWHNFDTYKYTDLFKYRSVGDDELFRNHASRPSTLKRGKNYFVLEDKYYFEDVTSHPNMDFIKNQIL